MNPWNRIIFAQLDGQIGKPESNEIRFLLASEDDLRVTYYNREILLKQGDFLIINAKANLTIAKKQWSKGFLIKFYVTGNDLSDLSSQRNISTIIEGCSAIECSHEDQVLKQCLMQFVNLKLQAQSLGNAPVLKTYYEILTLIEKHYLTVKRFRAKQKIGSKEQRANEIKDYIDTNFRKNLTLKSLASHFFLSTAYTSHLFKEVFKESFHQYVTKLKMQSAIDDIVNTNNTMTDIALQSGFPNIGSFNSAFKKRFDMTPTEFRKNKRQVETSDQSQILTAQLRPKLDNLIDALNQPTSVHEQHFDWHELLASETIQPEFNQNWGQVINLGDAESLLMGTMARQIRKVQSDIQFEFGRLWGLFTDDMLMINS